MSELNYTFAANIRKLRKKQSFSQKEFADLINCSEKTVSKWECGDAVPGIEILLAICRVFKTNLDSLFSQEGIYFLGIDGGGTKTALALMNENGDIVQELLTDCCNPIDIGIEKAEEVLKQAIYEICGIISMSSIYLFAGIAGGKSGKMAERLNRFFGSFGFAGYQCDSDNCNIVAAGLGINDGISLILGTGICAYTQKNCEQSRVAGWGYFIDNGGSAYNFGRDALNAYFTALDSSGEKTAISEEVEKLFPEGGQKLIEHIYKGGKKEVASFAIAVFRALEKGDKVAEEILNRNMKEAARVLETAAQVFGEEKINVVVAGGLTNQPIVLKTLKLFLKNPDRYDIRILNEKPVMGALILAKGVKENA